MGMNKITIEDAKKIAEKKGLLPGKVKGTDGVQFTKKNSEAKERIEVISWDEFEKLLNKKKLAIYESGGFMKIMKK
ncbi:MAG: hypothetical protein ACP5RS_00200 [Thermoplasmata archaeon]|jgi:hypothetical protein